MPWTELWLSCVNTSWDRRPNGYRFAHSRHAAVALAVKMEYLFLGGGVEWREGPPAGALLDMGVSCACAGRPAPA